MLEVSIQNVRSRLAEIKQKGCGLVGQAVAASLSLGSYIPIPPMMERNIDKLFILGDAAGPSCVHLVRLLIQYNATVERITSQIVTLNAELSRLRLAEQIPRKISGFPPSCFRS